MCSPGRVGLRAHTRCARLRHLLASLWLLHRHMGCKMVCVLTGCPLLVCCVCCAAAGLEQEAVLLYCEVISHRGSWGISASGCRALAESSAAAAAALLSPAAPAAMQRWVALSLLLCPLWLLTMVHSLLHTAGQKLR